MTVGAALSTTGDYATGWVAAAALAAAILVALRNLAWRRASRAIGSLWFRAHYWLGTAAVLLGVGHCLSSVTRARLPLGPEIGIWAAAAAAAVLVATGLIGGSLRGAPPRDRAQIRRNHLLAM